VKHNAKNKDEMKNKTKRQPIWFTLDTIQPMHPPPTLNNMSVKHFFFMRVYVCDRLFPTKISVMVFH